MAILSLNSVDHNVTTNSQIATHRLEQRETLYYIEHFCMPVTQQMLLEGIFGEMAEKTSLMEQSLVV